MFNKETEVLFKTTIKMLKEAKNVANEESKKIDKEWLEKINTTMSSINSNSNDSRTVSEVIASAKKERDYLSNELSLYANNTEKQMNISKRLYDLNTVISSYENAYEEKENRKFDILKNKETDIITSMLDGLIEKTDKEISALKSNIDSKLEELRTLAGQVNFEKITKKLENSNKKLVEFNNLKKALEELKTYNGNIVSDKKLIQLTSNLQGYNKYIITTCYNLIVSNNVNLSKEKNKIPLPPRGDNPVVDEELETAKKAIEKVEKHFDKDDFIDAYEKVNALKDSKEKEDLLKRLSNITDKLVKRLDSELKKLEKIEINSVSDIDLFDREKLNTILNLFDFLNNYAIEFNGTAFGERMESVVNKFNMQQQNKYKLTKEDGPIKKFGFWAKMRQLRPFITSRKDHILKVYKKALVNSTSAEEKKEAIEGIKQIDVVNGVRLFRARNKLNKLKEKLRVSGTDSLDEKEQKKYDKSVNTISARIISELKKSMGDSANDKIRVKTVIGQLLEVLSICPKKIEVANVFGIVKETLEKKDIFKDTLKYVRNAYTNGSLNEQEYKAYVDEINNIALYRNNVDDYYEVPSVSVNGEEEYSELDNETKKYYESPVKYSDENKIETDISYVRK